MQRKKHLIYALTLILSLLLTAYAVGTVTLSEEMEIYDKALRLHIPANSDKAEDQAVKLKVRDEIITMLAPYLEGCASKEEAVTKVQSLSNVIRLKTNSVLKENGFDYEASVSVNEEYYPTRDYEGLSLPAGVYTSLKIELGEGKGANWWCVLFPQVCVGCARPSEALAQVGFTPNQIKLLTEQENEGYTVKFKLVELYKQIFG